MNSESKIDLFFDKVKDLINLDDLKQYKGKGVIAGGAVSNFLYGLKVNKEFKVNDLDVFIFHKRDKPSNKNLDGAVDDYAVDINFENNLKIRDTERKGLINIINIDVDYINNLSELATQLLQGFDINATMSAITLEDNPQLIVLKSMEEFLTNSQIKCVKTHTPIKTMLRLLKKKEELGCFLNESHLKALFQYARYNRPLILKETYDKFEIQIKSLNKYFKAFKLTGEKYKFFCNKEEFIDLHRNEKKLLKDKNLQSFLLPYLEMYLNQDKRYLKYKKVRPYLLSLKLVISSNYNNPLKDDFNEDKIVYLEKLLRQVQVLRNYFGNMSLHSALEDSIYLTSIKEPLSLFLSFCGHLSSSNCSAKAKDLKLQYNVYKEEYRVKAEPLSEPLDLPKKLRLFIKELNSQIDLETEGLEMGHCVGGYSQAVKEGRCKIFSITSENKIRSTIELRKNGDTWIGIQHRSKFNKFPDDRNREISFNLINHLNSLLVSFKTKEMIEEKKAVNQAGIF